MRVAALSTSFLALLASAAALGRPEIKGSKFFLDGEQFFFKGIAYQPEKGDPNPAQADPLADAVGCKRDVEVFKGLGINSIRVYQTDPAQNHDECMKLLSDAGIYVVLDLASSQKAINRADPQWDTDLYNYYLSKVDAFAGYDNVAAFLVGNEVANSVATVNSAEYVKAAARDVKAYIKQKKLSIPIGYASNDEPEIRDDLREYFDCGSDDVRLDFYGINLYQWCGNGMDFKTSGYEAVVKEYENYDIPVLLTEYGCNNPRPRTFPEIKSIYDSDMTGTFSGGFMYMYSEEANGYGIADVSYGKPGYEKTEDFDNFKDALAAVDPKGVSERDYKPSAKPSACPNKSGTWPFEADAALPPTPKEGDRSQYTKGGVAKSINGSDDSDDEASPDSSESSAARGLLGASSSVVALVAAALAHLI